jgi:hypothetical protein
MPVRFVKDTDDQRRLLEDYLCVEEVPRKSPASPTVLVARLTGVPHNQMAEDVERRLLRRSLWAFQEHKRKEAARQALPIVKTATIPISFSNPKLLTQESLVSLLGKKITLTGSLKSASLTQPFYTAEDFASIVTRGGIFEKECTFEVFAHHRESVRNCVRDRLTLMEIPLSEDVAQKLAKDDWLAECLAEALMNEERAAENIIDDLIKRINVTDVVRSVRERVLTMLTEFGYLSAPPAALQTWLTVLANDDSVAAVLRRHDMNVVLVISYLVEEATGSLSRE